MNQPWGHYNDPDTLQGLAQYEALGLTLRTPSDIQRLGSSDLRSVAYACSALLDSTYKGNYPQSTKDVDALAASMTKGDTLLFGINHFDGKDYPGAQEPLISKELFNAVQKKLHNKQPMLRARHNPVLKNMIRCQNCGATVTWERHKERYYGACQRKETACKGLKFLREDRAEELVLETLQKLVSPSQEIIAWTSEAIRAESQHDAQYYEQSAALINSKLSRIELMDETLYDDKLAGDISKERYETKHDQLMAEKASLLDQLNKLEEQQQSDFEGGLTVLELSQKAAEIYASKVPEQKRIIITELFEKLISNGDALSVTYTKFTNAIAKRQQKRFNFWKVRK